MTEFRPNGYALIAGLVCIVLSMIAQIWLLVLWLTSAPMHESLGLAVVGAAAAELLGLWFFLEWKNRRVWISTEGIGMRNWLGRDTKRITWDEVVHAEVQRGSEQIALLIVQSSHASLRIPETVDRWEDLVDLANQYLAPFGRQAKSQGGANRVR